MNKDKCSLCGNEIEYDPQFSMCDECEELADYDVYEMLHEGASHN